MTAIRILTQKAVANVCWRESVKHVVRAPRSTSQRARAVIFVSVVAVVDTPGEG